MSILVVGSVALDTIKTPAGRKERLLGGSAVYFSLIASFFSKVNLSGVVGEDFPGKYLNILKKRKNIDLDGLETLPGKTFSWQGEYGPELADARTIKTELNVFGRFKPSLPQKYKTSPFVFLANIDPDIQQDILRQTKKPYLAAADTMNFWIQNKRKSLLKLLKQIDLLFINKSEAEMLTNRKNIFNVAESIVKLGPKIVVIKKGGEGSFMFSRRFYFYIPAFLIRKIKDPTGAGDSFAGGFMGCLAKIGKAGIKNLKKALIYGNIMASFTIEDFSINQLLRVDKNQINRRMKTFKQLLSF